MLETRTRWGIIGPGKIARRFAADLSLVPAGELVAVSSRDLSRARSFADDFGAHMVFDDHEDMLSSAALDIVYVASPHTIHLPHTLAALGSGVAVLCEKPMGINHAQVSAMVEAAQRKGTFLMEALWTRFIPATKKVLDLIASGQLGEVVEVEADFCFSAPMDVSSRLYDLDLGGGSLLDIGLYPVFLAYLLLGSPAKIEATGQLGPTGADQTCSMQFYYDDHKSAALHSSILYESEMTARISLTKGYILMHPRWHEAAALTVLKAGEEAVEIACPPLGKGYAHEIMECHDCLRRGVIQSDGWRHTDSLRLAGMLDEIRRQIGVRYPAFE